MVIQHPSPNFGARRGAVQPDMVVLHYTAIPCAASLERLCDPQAEVSAHYLISETGRIWQLVPEDKRAWHAGAGKWGSVTDVNSHSIGIELVNLGTHPFAEPQMAALEWLLAGIMQRWAIRPERVIGHSDMAPDRKSDPGPRFDWHRLARQGLAVWPDVCRADHRGEEGWSAETILQMGQALRRFGYVMPDNDMAPLHVYHAFCDRFGCGGAENRGYAIAMARDLAARFPVDRDVPNA
ncbi:MAG: N-acetylmuramoyl-L-alanine amidase [Thalassovita sp.]